MNNIGKTLEKFGLSRNEAVVYLEAIKHKEISPYKLARLTGIPRTTVYDLMMSLALKGLITVKTSQGLEKQQTWIIAKNPSVLRDTVFKRREELMQLEVDIVDILSRLKEDFLGKESNACFRFLPGKEGVSEAYRFMREMPDTAQIYFFDHMMPMDTLGKKYVNTEVSQSLKDRIRTKRVKTIMPLNDWTRHVLSYQYGRNKSYIDYHEYRCIDDAAFRLDNDIYIVADRVIFICAKDEEQWAGIITSKLVAASLKSLFLFVWRAAEPVTESYVKRLGANEFLKTEKRKKM